MKKLSEAKQKKGAPQEAGYFWGKMQGQDYATILLSERVRGTRRCYAISLFNDEEVHETKEVEWHVAEAIKPPHEITALAYTG